MLPFTAGATDGTPRLINKSNFKTNDRSGNKSTTSKAVVNKSRQKSAQQASVKPAHGRRKATPAGKSGIDSVRNYADLVMDAKTGRILHATAPDELRHPASLTKMMTLYLAFDALKSGKLRLNDLLPVSHEASIQEPSKLGLRPGQQIRVEDALLGLAIKSANDATVVFAEALGGSVEGFARMMTQKARDLGMNRSVFRNPSGLPNPEQVTTARDMAILGYALIYHFPQFYPYFSRDKFSYAGVSHRNHNRLMSRYQGMDGIKTGFIRASGFNLVASTVRGSDRLIGVVFGGRSAVERDNRMAALLDQSFAQLQSVPGRRVDTADNRQLDGDANVVPVQDKSALADQDSGVLSATAEQTVASEQTSVAQQPLVTVVAKEPQTQLVAHNDRSHYKDYYTLSLSFVGMMGVIIFLKQKGYPYLTTVRSPGYSAHRMASHRTGWA
ncbi:MAG: D-alanyl-D-alanine carboxypeptidase [Magnetococcales bacterium]|nr:D-alanyl-D-alanine carboxypeptidase [Magnetococcales bacterium]MBF0148818.1 D-alanyl-D-alanine carboxypeptidase [Magnetococcales bacterium]MBF0173418.1 D-alanyl-D-alanine carboxypeptidase [Magnetococcales bacterium]MBF0346456.1 D-alanyl-D-alanine carboxypeptidase [Magnetococcales bacterium]MBF0629847.1 D-alanyl-D-alanine carboxypeptidase [Magnetococcales bacterium]